MGIEPYADRLIGIKARKLVGQAGFTESDREDIEQELRLRLLRRLPDYDPDLGSLEAFVACRIEQDALNILRARGAQADPYPLSKWLCVQYL